MYHSLVRVGEERRYCNGVPRSSTPSWELYLELSKFSRTLEWTGNSVPYGLEKFQFLCSVQIRVESKQNRSNLKVCSHQIELTFLLGPYSCNWLFSRTIFELFGSDTLRLNMRLVKFRNCNGELYLELLVGETWGTDRNGSSLGHGDL